MKTLSTKTLQNMYIKAMINDDESLVLHNYLLCFSNLYGCIQISELWDIFKQYKEKITKEKFYDFIDISQREENDYAILNLNEAYSGEISTLTKDKLLVNKSLIKRFDLKFWYLHRLEEFKDTSHGPYIPSKEELFKFNHDVFYESKAGKDMILFISNLKTIGVERNKYNEKIIPIVDLDGNRVIGKKLKDIVCYSHWEKFEIDRCKKENQKKYLIKEYTISCAEKMLNEIKRYILIEEPKDVTKSITHILDYLIYDFGVDLSEDDMNKFLSIYTELTNNSYRWSIYGWSPNELRESMPIQNGPLEIKIGPNMQKMIDEGKYDLKEMEDFFKEKNLDIRVINQKDDDSYENIIKENENYLNEFREFLEKRNYRESIIDKHVSRVEYYINDYLMWGFPKHMEKGCSLEVLGFIEGRVNERVIPPSVHNIDFFLASIRLFYECMLEKRRISKKDFIEFEEDIRNFKDEMIEDYYDKNPKEIDLYDVMQTIEEAHGFGEGYINIKTGQKEYVPEDESLYFGDIEELYDKLDGLNWIKVPDVNDYEIMTQFSAQVKNKNQSNRLHVILHNKKAYRNFKDAIYEMDIEDDYFDFYDSKLEDLAKQWLETNNLKDEYD